MPRTSKDLSLPITCPGCGAEFIRAHGNQKFCAPKCSYTYKAGGSKSCGGCGAEFFASHRNQGYCSDACRAEAWSPRKPERVWVCEVCAAKFRDSRERRFCSSPECVLEGKRRCSLEYMRARKEPRECVVCGVESWWRGAAKWCPACIAPRKEFPSCRISRAPKVRQFIGCQCRECGTAFVVAPYSGQEGEHVRARYCSKACSERANRHAAQARRRARLKGARVETVYRRKVFERDGWICRLCRKPVDRDAVVPANLAPTIDHILPLALGGLHGYANVQTAHFICNAHKRDQVTQLSFAA